MSDFTWSHDGAQALISYRDGFVLVGSVSGQRHWSSEINLESQITCGIWTPDDQQVTRTRSASPSLVCGQRCRIIPPSVCCLNKCRCLFLSPLSLVVRLVVAEGDSPWRMSAVTRGRLSLFVWVLLFVFLLAVERFAQWCCDAVWRSQLYL